MSTTTPAPTRNPGPDSTPTFEDASGIKSGRITTPVHAGILAGAVLLTLGILALFDAIGLFAGIMLTAAIYLVAIYGIARAVGTAPRPGRFVTGW